MAIYPSLLILAAFAASATNILEEGVLKERPPEDTEVFACDFFHRDATDSPWDANYDGWPDQWTRAYGPDKPPYVKAAIQDDPSTSDGKRLTVTLNGGGAEIASPTIAVSDKFSYVVAAQLRIEEVQFARTQLRLEFLDEQGEVLQSTSTPWFQNTEGWVATPIGPVNPTSDQVRSARIVLYVEAGRRADLTGVISLDDVWMARRPKMVVKTNNPFNVYLDPQDIEITCELSGILDKNPDILFELYDASSRSLDNDRVQLEGRLIEERLSRGIEILDENSKRRAGYTGDTSWKPPIREPGYYRVRISMKSATDILKEEVISIAVLPPLNRSPRGEFGWSLAGDAIPLTYAELGNLLPQVSVSWLKLPVWYDPNQAAASNEVAAFAEQLAAKDIEVVGVVDMPQEATNDPHRSEVAVADALSADQSSWMPLLDPILTRLSLRIRWWQIGNDHDASFSTFPHVEKEIETLRNKLFRFGQDISLGIGWNWNNVSSMSDKATWEFEQFSSNPPLTAQELTSYLELSRRPGVQRWVLVEPLSKRHYALDTRIRDLIEQILAAKIQGADAIFASRPFDDEHGLMSDRGAPSELLLPWRTTASLLGGARHLGSIQLPHNSPNRIFQLPDGEMLMVVWSENPTRESIYLGDDVRVVDVWGREKIPTANDGLQTIEVDRLPIFVKGLNPYVAKCRLSVRFSNTHIPSIFGKTHPITLQLANEFPMGVGGTVDLLGPDGWQIDGERGDLRMAVGEQTNKIFGVSLPFDANSGVIPVRLDFNIVADKPYKFSVYRELEVGDGLIDLDVHTQLNGDGELIVEQRMTNRSEKPVDFKCLLYAHGAPATADAPAVPQRRRQRIQVFRLGSTPDVKTYRYPDGAELLGTRMWLRAEEIDGPRVLNYHFEVER